MYYLRSSSTNAVIDESVCDVPVQMMLSRKYDAPRNVDHTLVLLDRMFNGTDFSKIVKKVCICIGTQATNKLILYPVNEGRQLKVEYPTRYNNTFYDIVSRLINTAGNRFDAWKDI